MNQNERAHMIIRELMAIPKDMWDRSEHGGHTIFAVDGHSGHALYFSETLMNPDSEHPLSLDAMELYRARLGDKPYAVEVWDEENCVCLLRWENVEEIEVAEYKHGPWELVSFSLPPIDDEHSPTIH
jgi:hypothetical protein